MVNSVDFPYRLEAQGSARVEKHTLAHLGALVHLCATCRKFAAASPSGKSAALFAHDAISGTH